MEIKTIRTYDEDMWKAKAELNAGKLPELKGALPENTGYDTVISGGLVWGQTISNPMLAYMIKTDFSGKTVSSFWTFYDHDENYNGDMKKEAKGARAMYGVSLPRTITENPDIFDFSLTDEEMEQIKPPDKQQGVDGLRHDDPKMIELLQSF